MALYVNTNISALDAANSLARTEMSLEKTTQQLSSGLRINSAADDAAGLTISQNLQGQIGGIDQANRNAQDGVSLVQTASGALTQVQSMLQRIRELAVQYGNGTLNSTDQTAITTEVNQLLSEIQQIGSSAAFNGVKLLNGSTATITLQVGANDGETISVATISLGSLLSPITSGGGGSGSGSTTPGLVTDLATGLTYAPTPVADISGYSAFFYNPSGPDGGNLFSVHVPGQTYTDPTVNDGNPFAVANDETAADFTNTEVTSSLPTIETFMADGDPLLSLAVVSGGGGGGGGGGFALGTSTTLSSIDAAISAVSGAASTFGATQNRLQYSMANLATASENLTAANSRITEVDMASAMTTFTSEQVLQQAGTAMLTQAQKLPDAVLSLLQGV